MSTSGVWRYIIVDMSNEHFLRQIGLSEREVKVYLDIAAHPETTVLSISKRIDIPRTTLYTLLDALESAGRIHIKKVNKTTIVSIVEPQNLLLELRSEQTRINELLAYSQKFIEQMHTLAKTSALRPTVNIYADESGIKQLLWNILHAKDGVLLGFSPGTLEDIVDRRFAEEWRVEFKRRKLRNKIILNTSVPLDWSEVPEFLTNYVEARTLEDQKISFEREVFIYDDVLAIVAKKDEPEQYGIEISDRLLVDSYKQLFFFLWNHVAKPI